MRRSLPILLTLALFAPGRAGSAPAAGDIVGTADGRIAGKAMLGAKSLSLAGRDVPWQRVAYALLNRGVRPPAAAQAVWLRTGEVWRGRVESLARGRLAVRVQPFGRREIDANAAAFVEFAAGRGRPGKLAPRTLYADGRPPMPAALLWFDAERIAVDSPFGAITLKREDTLWYVFQPPGEGRLGAGEDEVSLVNGTVLRGRLAGAREGVRLKHALLGDLAIPAAMVRTVLRHAPSAVPLTEVAPASVKAAGPTGPMPAAEALTVLRFGESFPTLAFVRALRLEAGTVVRYALGKAAGPRQLRAVLAPIPHGRGDLQIRISSGSMTLSQALLKEGDPPVPLAVPIPESGAIAIEASFGEHLGVPCAAVLADPIVALAPEAPAKNQAASNE